MLKILLNVTKKRDIYTINIPLFLFVIYEDYSLEATILVVSANLVE